MGPGTVAATALVIGALAAAPATAQPGAQGVKVQYAAARLVVIAEPRNTVSVTVAHGPSRLPPLQVRQEGGVIVVDGGLNAPFGDRIHCVGGWSSRPMGRWFGFPVTHVRDTRAVRVDGIGRIEYGDLPVITAHVPLDAGVSGAGAVWGEVGATNSLHLDAVGCGDWRAGPVRGRLDVASTGDGDVTVQSAGEAQAQLAGSGDIDLGPVAGAADLGVAGSGDVRTGPLGGGVRIKLAGSGDIDISRIQGPVIANVASSGDVRIAGGYAPDVHVSMAGSGDFSLDGTAGQLSASIVGSGDVRVAHVAGPVSKSVIGSGEVTVGR